MVYLSLTGIKVWHLIYFQNKTECFFVFAGELKNADHFRYSEETRIAWEAGKLSADITEEQRKLTEADLVIFQVAPRVAVMSLC